MSKLIAATGLGLAVLAQSVLATPVQAGTMRPSTMRHHHHHAAAVNYPDSVTLNGQNYKVCKAGMQDDCVEPRQAGLGFGNRPTNSYHPAH